MIVYHGSYLEISKPDLTHSRVSFRTEKASTLLHFEGSETL